jgi:hypothetical protein
VSESWSRLVSKPKKRHPAFKHGGFSSTAVLPGENPAEFEHLREALMVELAPRGALEESIVADIARLEWRKRNLATFSHAENVRALWSEIREKRFCEEYADAPDTPDSPCMLSDSERDKVEKTVDAMIGDAQKELGDDFRLLEIGDRATVEGLLRDLEIEGRIDGLIDKGLKRLLFLRGLKSLATPSSSAPPQPIAEPQRIPRSTRAA